MAHAAVSTQKIFVFKGVTAQAERADGRHTFPTTSFPEEIARLSLFTAMPTIVIATLVALLVLITLLPLSRATVWWIRDMDFPRLQIAAGAALLLAAALALLDLDVLLSGALITVTAACLLYQAWWIYPYTRLHKVEVLAPASAASHERIRILTANVLTENRNADGLIDLIRAHDPDIFVTLESDAWWQQRLDGLEKDYPYTMKCPLDNLYGMHVYSRLPLRDSAIQFLVEDDIPSMHAMAELPTGLHVRLHFLHPAPPSPTEHAASTERDAELLMVAKSVAQLRTPVIVAGDLNDVAWSTTTRLFRKISGLLDPRIGRGMFNTFHAGHWFMRWPLDHLFHSQHFTLSFIKRLPAFGSDHFPVLVELTYDKALGARQHGLVPDASDMVLGEKKIHAKAVSEDMVHEPQD